MTEIQTYLGTVRGYRAWNLRLKTGLKANFSYPTLASYARGWIHEPSTSSAAFERVDVAELMPLSYSGGQIPWGRELEAKCNAEPCPPGCTVCPADVSYSHEAPNKECSCGIWGYHTLDGMYSHLNMPHHAVGVVSLTGRILVHKLGFRARRATIEAVTFSPQYELRHYAMLCSMMLSNHPHATSNAYYESRQRQALSEWCDRNDVRFMNSVEELVSEYPPTWTEGKY